MFAGRIQPRFILFRRARPGLRLCSGGPFKPDGRASARLARGQRLLGRCPGKPALPLQEGDTLETQGGLAEIEFETGATAYLAENSVLQFTQLAFSGGGRITQLNLTQGAGTFYANLTRQDSFRVVTSTFEAAIPERAEFRVDAFRDSASIQVFLGEVSVTTSAGSTTFEKGQSVAIHEGDFQNPSVARLPEPDSFDSINGSARRAKRLCLARRTHSITSAPRIITAFRIFRSMARGSTFPDMETPGDPSA